MQAILEFQVFSFGSMVMAFLASYSVLKLLPAPDPRKSASPLCSKALRVSVPLLVMLLRLRPFPSLLVGILLISIYLRFDLLGSLQV